MADVDRLVADRADPTAIPDDNGADAPSPATRKTRARTYRPAVAPLAAPPPAPPIMTPTAAPGLERRDQQRLRRGKVEIEARLDLHGMTQRAAEDALTGFLIDSRGRGRRSVLVITGKGGRDGGEGVLKRMVPIWLNGPALRDHVRGFSYAAPKHGGEGALYVLLKRRRA